MYDETPSLPILRVTASIYKSYFSKGVGNKAAQVEKQSNNRKAIQVIGIIAKRVSL